MSSGYPGWTKPGPYYDPDGPPWIEETGETGDRRWLTVLSYVAVAVVAAGIAVALTLVLRGPAQPAGTGTPPGNQSQNEAPPGNAGQNGGPQQVLMLAGRVSKVSRTSITITGPNGSVTAAITDSTHITGNVKTAQDIRVGDRVSAQIANSNGKSVATAIQDPAQVP